MAMIDNTNELTYLISEFGKKRVELIDKAYPDALIRTIEHHLDNWKEESHAKQGKIIESLAYNLGYVDKFGSYFDFE